MKKWIVASLLMISSLNLAQAVQVLPAPAPGPGYHLGKGLGDGFNRGLQIALAKKEAKKQQEEQAKQMALEQAVLVDLLQDYDPAKNNAFVLKILQSNLSNNTKNGVINILNEQHRLYLEEQKAKKGIWSWFKK